MKKLLIFAFFLFIAGFLCAQQANGVGASDPEMLGIESGQQELKEVSVDKFEHDGFWRSTMSGDEGYITSRLFAGSPAEKRPIPEEEGMGIPDKYVLGARVDFLRRGVNSFTVYPTRPIPIEGITKEVSVWIAGRNFNHEIVLLIQDFFGRNYEIRAVGGNGKLNFMGWKQIVFTIPPSPDGVHGVVQRNYHYNNQMGIKIMGFRIECDLEEAYGSYYIYFDDLRAVTDLFAEHNRDADDMADGW
ncbi:MAG: flagellar filament outer layer protein FlaA [Treponema sp.]|jgi:hypothetical protein|nr:flagellar filament outer layer protein FlaA [Treponema sp.]